MLTLSLVIKSCSLSGAGAGSRPSHGKFMPCSQADRGGQKTLSVSGDSQLLSAQNNAHVKMAYFGVVYSGPLQRQEWLHKEVESQQSLLRFISI